MVFGMAPRELPGHEFAKRVDHGWPQDDEHDRGKDEYHEGQSPLKRTFGSSAPLQSQ
jgi:hypothetical protein